MTGISNSWDIIDLLCAQTFFCLMTCYGNVVPWRGKRAGNVSMLLSLDHMMMTPCHHHVIKGKQWKCPTPSPGGEKGQCVHDIGWSSVNRPVERPQKYPTFSSTSYTPSGHHWDSDVNPFSAWILKKCYKSNLIRQVSLVFGGNR